MRLEWFCSCAAARGCLYFNSIKVRLEYNEEAIYQAIVANFNSIKVRLEFPYFSAAKTDTILFQFHKGAIGVKDISISISELF